MPARPLVVFDLDGTLADTAQDLIAILNDLLAQDGLPGMPMEQAGSLIGAGARALISRGFASAGRELAPERLETLFETFLARYADEICTHTRLYPGVEATLDRLDAEGYAYAICTNKPERHSLLLMDALGMTKRFAAICGRETFPFCKPDPRHLTETIARAGGDPARALMVGDSITDIATAKAAGIPVIAVPFGYTDVPVAELEPDLVVTHFDAMPEAILRLMPRG
ncbi:phosphoglycolate phosphatase [Salinarimonas ramus]|uniref:Phosphoglycolate phosphatase n=1 Tax=Salinarimonas ramus TaxID=690164 RepID=A0A917QB98_9HYPH|nr:phosphoglycolate phosphatase [Salinarimonas ramus]GGK40002.1 phosphoglycolate phosphatase, bacterial [Salinarimonas ramus]